MSIVVDGGVRANPLVFPQNWGMSDTAREMQKETEELQNEMSRSITFGEHLSEMMQGLFEASRQYASENWDGEGARAIGQRSYENAVRFILSFTPDTPAPEIDVDPDGEVVFEWNGGKRRVFSISIGSRNELTYAGLYGTNTTHGVEQFHGSVPEALLDNIHRVFPRKED